MGKISKKGIMKEGCLKPYPASKAGFEFIITELKKSSILFVKKNVI